MANWRTPEDLKYAESDEWFKVEGGVVTLGITDYAQDHLSDIVYVELPDVGKKINAGEAIAVIESVKAASDVYSVVSGEVIEVNDSLEDQPEKVNEDPYDDGWFIKVKVDDTSPLDKLMDSKAYSEYCESRE
jgi:glycine cleavage system H protein